MIHHNNSETKKVLIGYLYQMAPRSCVFDNHVFPVKETSLALDKLRCKQLRMTALWDLKAIHCESGKHSETATKG